ncbi:MAG TPA: OmpW family outer membrane protein [Kofleriaceae bacterium]|nr:OmpW family outer membrane protein [Kofleriaceae bacterium]
MNAPRSSHRARLARAFTVSLVALVAAPAVALAQPPDADHAPEPPPPARPARGYGLYLRLGGALIAPVSSSHEMELADVQGPASLAVHNGPIAGSGAKVDSAMIPALIVGYVLPFGRRRWSLETVLGPPFTVKFESTGTLANMSIAPTALGIPTGVGPLGTELGEATAVPPVLTAVYRMLDGGFRPYAGAGGTVMFSYNEHVTNPTLTAVSRPEMSIAPAPGLVLQGGFDALLWKSARPGVWKAVYARLDVKFIAFLQARAEVRHLVVETPGLPLFDNVEVGTARMNLWVNPFIVQAAVGADF